MISHDISRLSADDLINEVTRAAAHERGATVRLIALLAEFDARRLYLGLGCSSLFAYCTNVLHLSEHSTYHRIEAARAVRAYPLILDRLAEGALTLTAVGLLRSHLTAENHLALLDAARHQSKREVERIVAGLAPRPDAAPTIRRLPPITPLRVSQATTARRPAGLSASVNGPGVCSGLDAVAPSPSRLPAPPATSDDRYLVRLTIGGDTLARLERARDLLRHSIPSGDPAAIVDRALMLLVQRLERTKFAATPRPQANGSLVGRGRHIPAAVRRVVCKRDGGRCTFEGAAGRCTATGQLEFHHVKPYARGGATDAGNLTLRCRAHNAHEARLEFGDRGPWVADAVGAAVPRRLNSARTESLPR
jgi:hypothetical protein